MSIDIASPIFKLFKNLKLPKSTQDINSKANAYEGSSQSYRLRDKGLGGGGPNISTAYSLPVLRDRTRHAIRNNPYANRAIETYVANLVGNGIRAKWDNAGLQSLWNDWTKQADFDDDESFHGIQALIAREQFEAGEVLARFRVCSKSHLTVPLQIQVIESDHLDIAYTRSHAEDPVKMGIRFDKSGKKSGYHLWCNHPSDKTAGHNERVLIKADDMLHIFRKLRAGQLRGMPELSTVLVRLYEIDEMQDATLVRQKTAALFGWIVRKREAGEDVNIGNPVTSHDETEPLTEITPGGIHYLEDDEDIEFSQPADIAGVYVDWLKSELRAVAAGVGITYEQLTGDLEGVNYSSIRSGLIEFRRRLEFLQLTLLVHKFCDKVAEKWLRVAILTGVAPPEMNLKNYRNHLPEWRPPRWEWVDPLKDAQADLLEVQAGFATLKDKQLERGNDPTETLEQLKKEQALDDLTLFSNPAKVNKAGQFQKEN